MGADCRKLQALGLGGNRSPLPRKERPVCGARNRQGKPCAVRVEPGKRKCRFHGDYRRARGLQKAEPELLRRSDGGGGRTRTAGMEAPRPEGARQAEMSLPWGTIDGPADCRRQSQNCSGAATAVAGVPEQPAWKLLVLRRARRPPVEFPPPLCRCPCRRRQQSTRYGGRDEMIEARRSALRHKSDALY
jgi:hypothetical protein